VKFFQKAGMAVLAISITLLGLTGCGKTSAPDVEGQGSLASIQKNKYLIARLYGVMTFDYSGTTVTFPTELIISSVPLVWMGPIFDGKVENNGPGNDVTDQVHGSVSADGTWIVSLSYSRQIIRPGDKSLSYRITLKNVPIANADTGTTNTPGTFEKTSDVQKYVQTIEYNSGIFTGGKIVPAITYVSTDWENAKTGMQPALKITFETKPSETLGPMPPPQPGMGMNRS
jgi:hypothetical protein